MRFNFISEFGDGHGIAKRVLDEGEDVRMWIRDGAASQIGDGIVPKVGALEDMLDDATEEGDVFILDGSANGLIAEYLKELGYSVLGGSVLADKLERDRQYGADVMKECGIETPKTVTFHSFEDGIKYAEEVQERLVYKPSKLLGENSVSHVCYDAEDCIMLLKNTRDENPLEKPEFDLQHFEVGIPISTECWFDGQQFLPLWNHTLERKELLDGNLGPSGGCTGNITWACGDCEICEVVKQIEPFLRKEHYHGPLDLNAIVSPNGFFGLEWTPRFGYDATPTLLFQLVDGSVSAFLSDLARRQYNEISSPRLRSGIAAGLRITIPPWPTERYHSEADIPIRGLSDKDYEDVYLYNVRQDKHEPTEYSSAGAWGILILPTGYGSSVKASLKKPYEVAEKVRIPDKQYRTDLVKQFEKDLTSLEAELGVEVMNG